MALCRERLVYEREHASSMPDVRSLFFPIFIIFGFFFLLRNHLPKGRGCLSVSCVKQKKRLEPYSQTGCPFDGNSANFRLNFGN